MPLDIRSRFTVSASVVGDSSLAQLESKTRRLETGTKSLSAQFAQTRAAFGGLAAAYAAFQGLQAFTAVADTYSRTQTALAQITESEVDRQQLSVRVFELAQSTRTEYEAQAQLVTRLSVASADLGVTQNEILAAAKTISQTFAISGASAGEAASSAQQLAQALGSGVLQGDELKSILENNQTLARAIADGFGVSVGQLKQMGKEGELLSRDVLQAILGQADKINAKFEKTVPTIAQGFTVLTNAATVAIGRLDEAAGFSRTIVASLQAIANAINPSVVDQLVQKTNALAGVEDARARREAAGNITLEQRNEYIEREVELLREMTRLRDSLGVPTPSQAASRSETPIVSEEDRKNAARLFEASVPAAQRLREEIAEIVRLKDAFASPREFEQALTGARQRLTALNARAQRPEGSERRAAQEAAEAFADSAEASAIRGEVAFEEMVGSWVRDGNAAAEEIADTFEGLNDSAIGDVQADIESNLDVAFDALDELRDRAEGMADFVGSAIEDGIFALFEDGADGMVDVFNRTLQQIALDIARSQIRKALTDLFADVGGGGGGGGFLEAVIGGIGSAIGGGTGATTKTGGASAIKRFATGGSFVVPGSSEGDKIIPIFRVNRGERIDITPQNGGNAGGGVSIVNNISAPGADPATESRIREQIRSSEQRTIAQVRDLVQRRRL